MVVLAVVVEAGSADVNFSFERTRGFAVVFVLGLIVVVVFLVVVSPLPLHAQDSILICRSFSKILSDLSVKLLCQFALYFAYSLRSLSSVVLTNLSLEVKP